MRRLAPLAALLLAACATPRAVIEAPPPETRLVVSLPEAAFEDLEAGLGRTVIVTVENLGPDPVAVTAITARGAGVGARSLLVRDPAGDRAFGFLPPGERGRWRLGLHFPEAGAGTLHLAVAYRLLPGARGAAMEEQRLPAGGAKRTLEQAHALGIAGRAFPREAAEARIGGPADAALWCATLGGWVLMRGNATFLVEVSQTQPFPGLSLEAAAFLDAHDDSVPVLDEDDRLRRVPKGPALRLLLDRARRLGLAVKVVAYSEGRQAIRVGTR